MGAWNTPVPRFIHALNWRVSHILRRATERASASLLRRVSTQPIWAYLPRAVIRSAERLLVMATDRNAFDASGYLQRNPDVSQAGRQALDHYLKWGWAEGRDARTDLPERAYRERAGLARRPVSALAHELAFRTRTGDAPPAPADLPPIDDILARLAAIAPPREGSAEVDVIVPVYRGRAETLNCLLRVLEAQNETRANLLVVDDCGPDRQLRADVGRLARRGLIERIVQPRNLGFVAAINAGMERHPDRDVIWLNSDTEVFGNWIDRLRRVACAQPDIATVTPLTNNGTIASYPLFDRDNPAPPECGWQRLDQLAAVANGGAAVDAPTCVGFCTYVRREAIAATGLLDRAVFGRGYGEENDFSCRAAALGWRNLIAGGVFVRHIGATSFGAERTGRIDHAMKALARRHPEYLPRVREYLAQDPPAPLRRALDVARLSDGPGASTVLMVTHERGGGTARYVSEQVEQLARAGRRAVFMTGGTKPGTVRLSRPGLPSLPSLDNLPFETAGLGPLLRALAVTEIQVQHLVEMPQDVADQMIWLADALDLPFDVIVHDYFAICPRINLAGLSGRYCGEPSVASCQRCLATRRSPVGAPDIVEWRASHERLLMAARLVKVPDQDVAERLKRYFPKLDRVIVHPHENVVRACSPGQPDGPFHIAVIGAIGPIKGFDVLMRLARHRRRADPPVRITVIGHTRSDSAARSVGIEVTGRYAEERVQDLISDTDPDVIFIPSTWPETFCYTLSHALRSGRPVAAFDLGAQANRLRAVGEGSSLIALAVADDPKELLGRLQAIACHGGAGQRQDLRRAV